MLPLIVIGADEVVMRALTRENLGREPQCLVRFFDSAEIAMQALNAGLAAAIAKAGYVVDSGQDMSHGLDDQVVVWDRSDQGWMANVFYGPKALGEATIGKPQRLAHTGWTAILTHSVQDSDPAKPRRMMAGIPEGEDQSSIVWQAAPMLQANFVVDVAARDSEGKPRGLLDVLNLLERQPQP